MVCMSCSLAYAAGWCVGAGDRLLDLGASSSPNLTLGVEREMSRGLGLLSVLFLDGRAIGKLGL